MEQHVNVVELLSQLGSQLCLWLLLPSTIEHHLHGCQEFSCLLCSLETEEGKDKGGRGEQAGVREGGKVRRMAEARGEVIGEGRSARERGVGWEGWRAKARE